MLKRVEKLTFQSFRGGCRPVTFEFKPDKNVVLIFGENGTGKSSIADAIDFVCNNGWGSLADRSGTTPKTHIVSLNSLAKDLAVELKYGGQTWRAGLQGGKPVTQPSGPPRAFILRRTDITRVMEAQPAERYKTLHAYITVAKVEEAEATLRKAYKEMQAHVDRAVQSRQQAGDALDRLWQAEGKPSADAQTWATHKTSRGADVQKDALAANRRLWEGINQAQNLRAALDAAFQQVRAAEAGVARAEQAVQAAAAGQAGQNEALVALLDDAQRYLSGVAAGEGPCPLCGKPEEQSVLLARVRKELHQLNQLQQLRAEQQRAQNGLAQAQGARQGAESALRGHCRTLAGSLLDAGSDYVEVVDLAALTAVDSGPQALAAALAALDALAQLQPVLAASVEEDQKTVNLWNALRTQLQMIAEAEQTMREQQATAQRLKAMLEIVEGERKLYVDQLVHAISGDVNALYTRIHPQEPLGGSSLYVKPNVTGSLELRAAFGGVADIAPGAYYSEAHLDTLGLCVYLALAKRGGGAIVVLDDVLTSVDDQHLERIIELLAEEARSLGQLIITTHSRAWYNRVRGGAGMDADLIRLYNWELAQGIRHNRVPLRGEELRQLLHGGPLDRQSAASKAGVLLEQLLDELVFRYGCRVPHKRNAAFALGELGDSIKENKKLGPVLKVETQADDGSWGSTPLKELIENCTKYTWVRNAVGAHFNFAEESIPDSTVREFAANVLALAEAMACPCCGQLPAKNKSGEYWECGGGCGKTRLRPLQTPG